MRLCWMVPAALVACSSSSQTRLPAPANLLAVRVPQGAALSWDAVPRATRYQVDGSIAGGGHSTLIAPGAQLAITWTGGDLTVQVRAIQEDGTRGDPTAPLTVPTAIPGFDLEVAGRTAHLSWTTAGTAVVARGQNVKALAPIATSSTGAYDDAGGEPGSTYFWTVQMGTPPLVFIPAPKSKTLPPLPPSSIALTYRPGSFRLSWDTVPGAVSYVVRRSARPYTDATTQFAASPFTGQPPFDAIDCGGFPDCSFEVAAATADSAIGLYSSPVHVLAPPAKPHLRTTVGVESVILDVDVPPLADRVIIARVRPGDPAFTDIGSVTTTGTFTDGDVPAWGTEFAYTARAVRDGGGPSLNSDVVSSFSTSAPTVMNLRGTGSETDVIEGQRITMPEGGALVAIEVGVAGPGIFFLDGTMGGLGGPVDGLLADRISGTFFRVPSNALVSKGESVDFEIVGSGFPALPPTVLLSDAAGNGGHMRHGSLDPDHDLLFKLFLIPAPPSVSGPLPSVTAGFGAARVTWVAAPQAVRYDVRRSDGGGPFALVAATAQTTWVDEGLAASTSHAYTVTAVAADGLELTGDSRSGTTFADRMDQMNLGDAPAAGVTLCAADTPGVHLLEQEFVAQSSGLLSGLAIAAESGRGTLQISVSDGNGAVLGSFPFGFVRTTLHPIDRVDPAPIDVGSLGIVMSPGQKFRLSLTMSSGNSCVTLRDTVDAYPAGTEIRDGVAVPGRDLAFATIVR